jgi:DNA-binding NtrC family response regulator
MVYLQAHYSMKKKDLEETIKEKVAPLLEETMQKNWGVTIPKVEHDITDQLKEPHLNIYVPMNLTFQQAKKVFKKEFMKNELRIHLGNISELAKSLDIDRRSIHRVINDLGININKLRHQELSQEKYQEQIINKTIKDTLDHYKEIIQETKMEKMYQDIPALSRNIAKFIPHQDMTWKEAEIEFEKQFFAHSLKENNGKISTTAKKIGIRAETLHRKVRKLGLTLNNE